MNGAEQAWRPRASRRAATRAGGRAERLARGPDRLPAPAGSIEPHRRCSVAIPSERGASVVVEEAVALCTIAEFVGCPAGGELEGEAPAVAGRRVLALEEQRRSADLVPVAVVERLAVFPRGGIGAGFKPDVALVELFVRSWLVAGVVGDDVKEPRSGRL